MKTGPLPISIFLSIAAFAFPPGCSKQSADRTPQQNPVSAKNSSAAPEQQMLPGGVAIPQEVRQNLGITFAQVELRQVEDTLRAPGVFELLPNARHEYRAPLSGHVKIRVMQFQEVSEGTVLFTLDSPEWRLIQHEAVEAEGEITMARANLAVAHARLEEAQGAARLSGQRVAELASVGVRKAEVEAEAAALTRSIPRLQSEIEAAEASLDEAVEHYHSRLRTLSSITGLTVDELLKTSGEAPAWRAIEELEVRAASAGAVDTVSINEGAWLETGELVLVSLNPTALRFHADVPQAELTRLEQGMPGLIIPPQGGGISMQEGLAGKIQIALTAHAEARTVSIYLIPEDTAPWARAGVSAYLEIPRQESKQALAIPVASLVQEGVNTIFFRRMPSDPDRVLPVKADLGTSDGRWVVVRSGVKAGDEVVVEGAYALKLASGGSQAPEGYHYHADGQLHKNH